MTTPAQLKNRFNFNMPKQPATVEDVPLWIIEFEKELEEFLIKIASNLSTSIKNLEYDKSQLPSPTPRGQQVYMIDSVGGDSLVVSNGTEWRRVADGGPI